MKNFFNKRQSSLAATELRKWAELGGLEDESTYSSKVLLSPAACIRAAEQFEYAASIGGRYYTSIISSPHFQNSEISAIFNAISFKCLRHNHLK